MSRTEKWTNDFLNRSEFFDRSHEQEVPEPLRSLARDLDAREPAGEDERQAKNSGRAYIDHEGNWHTGQYYTEQSDVPASLRMNSRWPAWKRNMCVWAFVGLVFGVPMGLWLWAVSLAFRAFIYWLASLFF